MWRSVVLVLGALVCPLSPAVRACGDGHTVGAVQPKPGAKKGAYIHKTVAVEIQGKLVFVRCLKFGRTSVGIRVKGETYWLDLHGDKELHRLLRELPEGNVLAKGTLEKVVEGVNEEGRVATAARKDFLVHVTSLAAAKGESVKKTVKVEIQGTLREDLREIIRPYGVSWYVKVEGKEYYLHFADNKGPAAQVATLQEKTVRLTGTLEVRGRWNIVHVTALAVAK